MKKIISLILVLSILAGNFTFAINVAEYETNNDKIEIEGNYLIKEISFDQLSKNNETTLRSSFSDSMLKAENISNINEIETFVKSQDLESYGLLNFEEVLLDELSELKKDDGYITNYKIYIPLETDKRSYTRSSNYYGSYNGFKFRESFVTFNKIYTEVNESSSSVQGFINNGVNFALIFAPKSINFAFFTLGAQHQNHMASHSVKLLTLKSSEAITQRFLLTQDLMGYAGSNPDHYVVSALDERRVVTARLTTDYASPYVDPDTSVVVNLVGVESSTWYNTRTKQMARCYNHYMNYNGAGYDDNSVGRFRMDW